MKIFNRNIDITEFALERIKINGCFQIFQSDTFRTISIKFDNGELYTLDSHCILVDSHCGTYVELSNGLCDLLIEYTPTCTVDDKIVFLWHNCYEGVKFNDIFTGKHQTFIETTKGTKPDYILSLSEQTFKKIDKRYNIGRIYPEFAPINSNSYKIDNIENYIAIHFRAYEQKGPNYHKDIKSLDNMLMAFNKIYKESEKYLILTDSFYIKSYVLKNFNNCICIDMPATYIGTPDDAENMIIKRDYNSLQLTYTEIWHAARCKELWYTYGRFGSYLINAYRSELGTPPGKKLV